MKRPHIEIEAPTREQLRDGEFELMEINEKRKGGMIRLGKAYRRTPMIEVLYRQEVISDAELKALRTYRADADLVDRSPVRDSLDRSQGGDGGDGPLIEWLNASSIVRSCERAAGSLAPLLRAIVVDDWTLQRWVCSLGHGRDRRRERDGRVDTWVEADARQLKLARLDFQMAAKRVQAELDA